MTVPRLFNLASAPRPETYERFISASRKFAEERGLDWEIPIDANGVPVPGRDWDLRILTGSHSRVASGINGFSVITEITEACRKLGWNPVSLPVGAVLSKEVQEFIQALVVDRCKKEKGERGTRHYARAWRKLFSSTNKMPWELTSEDLERFLGIGHEDGAIARATKWLAIAANQNILSVSCPLSVETDAAFVPVLPQSLTERKHAYKLPEAGALFELARIVFQEQPRSHSDLIRFSVVRLLILTGLRINEILMLPADCLRWEDHIDVVTGLPAGEVGGVSRSLWLRYFGEKRDETAPGVLVEDTQPIPDRFQAAVVEAVEVVLTATSGLRRILRAQAQSGFKVPKSDYRVFKTTAGSSADGFHVTPYGFCVNSFSLNPCTRHLKCFDECKHFAASGTAEHKISLEQLRDRMATARSAALSKPAKTVGRSNQIAHATKLLAGIEAALATTAGELVFPHGSDHSASPKDLFS